MRAVVRADPVAQRAVGRGAAAALDPAVLVGRHGLARELPAEPVGRLREHHGAAAGGRRQGRGDAAQAAAGDEDVAPALLYRGALHGQGLRHRARLRPGRTHRPADRLAARPVAARRRVRGRLRRRRLDRRHGRAARGARGRARARHDGADPELGLAGQAAQRRPRHRARASSSTSSTTTTGSATEALERLYATAIADEADIVIGKVVGHNKAVPRSLFRENVHELGLTAAPFNLLTPHKLFRRALLDEHGIRFPEGKRRLEDHMFVVPAYFAARNMAILADYACYHWVHWDSGTNASFVAPDPAEYFADVRRRARRRRRPHRARRVPRHALRPLVPRQAARADRPQRVRRPPGGAPARRPGRGARADGGALPAAARRGARRTTSGCARRSRGATTTTGSWRSPSSSATSRSRARVREYRGDGTWMTLRLECWLRHPDKSPLHGRPPRRARATCDLPEPLAARLEPAELDVTDALARRPHPAAAQARGRGDRLDRPDRGRGRRARRARRRAGAAVARRDGADRADDRRRRPAARRPATTTCAR